MDHMQRQHARCVSWRAIPHARVALDIASEGQSWDGCGTTLEKKRDRSGKDVGQQKFKKSYIRTNALLVRSARGLRTWRLRR